VIVLDCGNCGKTLRIAPEYAGQSGRCKGCGGVIHVPKAHVDIEEDWDYRAPSAREVIEQSVPVPPKRVMEPFAEPSPNNYVIPERDVSGRVGRKFLLGLLGSIALCIGVFAPLISMPIVGTQNYFANGQGDGTIVLGLAVISFVLVFLNRYRALWLTGLGTLAMIAFTFVRIQSVIGDMKSNMRSDLQGNPFAGMAEAMLGTVQIQWGWAVLLVGSALLIASAALVEDDW
jgi:hypothetical protein